MPKISIIVPLFNERDSISQLYREMVDVMQRDARSFEMVLVDDGSFDGTVDQLKGLAACDERVKLILFRRNFGQTAALHAGIQHATGDYLVTIDGDLQNDPRDIPMMIDELESGYDLVHGWRKDRQDKLINRKIPSLIANRLISWTTRVPIHDLGCTMKVIRRELAQQLELYGEMHRFIPILAHRLGARTQEVVTTHRRRQHGQTKYGIGRTYRVILDLITVKFMIDYFSSPMKLMGKWGLFVLAISFSCCTAVAAMKIGLGVDMTGNPLLLLGVIAAILSVQFFSLGLIGEICTRIYFSDVSKSNFQIRERINFSDAMSDPVADEVQAA